MRKVLSIGFAALLTACTLPAQKAPQTQLQMREYQTRTFETAKTNDVLSSVIDAFQDQGFMVKNVVPEVGLVAATREVDVQDRGQVFFQTFLYGHNARWQQNAIIEATANVKTRGNKTNVRLTFQEKINNNRGVADSVEFVQDPKFYQSFFEKISKSLFLEEQKF